MTTIKNPYAHKLLSERLRQEEKDLIIWNRRLSDMDEFSRKQAIGNIPSTEHRIKELKESILLIS